ncbi:uncharacterized protein LOC133849029 [Drosophila sulfurigaster albostrigata]|uniref:uncharacterized protein LOC133849029 n=1 Tax=Drosophila sulfurigaster albostrigata TaxID=89887 RepID=UPI002D21C0E2|nr:uncharacterized protein LOC133849029 [Drosophila sulfurigaster albostrigata]
MQTMQKICAESLISAVQSRTVLWNDIHKEYKNRNTTDKEWNEVGVICNCTGAAAKAKWKNLKDTYRRTLQKLPRLPSGSEAQTFNVKWPYLELMSFLKKTVAPDPTEGNLQQDDESMNDMLSDMLHEDESNMSMMSTTSTSMVAKSTPRKRKINMETEFLEIEKERLEMLRNQIGKEKETDEENKNEDLLFFKSLLPCFQKFTDIEKLEIRNEIQNILIVKIKNKE